jgi:D-serine dehydratase
MVHWQYKGLPRAAEETGEMAGLSLLEGDLMLPAAILRTSALAHNRGWMQRFLAATGVSLAPHGKTTMSPEIFAMQLADGAWGLTAATAHHVRAYRRFGVQRIIHANQLVAPADMACVFGELRADPTFDYFVFADSCANVQQLAAAVAVAGLAAPLNLLVEVGGMQGRTGARSVAEAMSVARAIAASPGLVLRGCAAFEGVYQGHGDGPIRMDAMLDLLLDTAVACDAEGLFATGEVILTAGGSSFFDRCASSLSSSPLGARVRPVLRSGCYISHDSGLYRRLAAAMADRSSIVRDLGEGLRPALEVWACIQSAPEPGLAIASAGKRDFGTDIEMPVPIWWYRPGSPAPEPLRGVVATSAYDQHVCLSGDFPFQVGDLIGLGVSHPCTTFDKWRALFVADDALRVVSKVTTCF